MEMLSGGGPGDGTGEEAADFLAWLEGALERLREADAATLARLSQESEWQVPPPSLIPLQELFEEDLACRRLLREPLRREPDRHQELQETAELLERSVEKTLRRFRTQASA